MPIPPNQLFTNPPSFDMATTESFPININMASYLTGSQSVQSSPVPTALVIDQSNNETITSAVSSSPSVSGNLIQVLLVGSYLRAQAKYILQVTCNITATETLTTLTTINVIL